jgi:NACalpha-BTF3-like transcription factor
MFPGLDPKKMQAVMKQMGIKQQEIDANRVIIECEDKNIIINNPSVIKINMQGQENLSLSLTRKRGRSWSPFTGEALRTALKGSPGLKRLM